MPELRVRIDLAVVSRFTLFLAALGGSIGFVEAGARGLAAGVASALLASLLSVVLGLLPIAGPLLYYLAWRWFRGAMLGAVAARYAVDIPMAVGLGVCVVVDAVLVLALAAMLTGNA